MPSLDIQTLRELCDLCASYNNKTAVLAFNQEGKEKLSFKELMKLVKRLAGGLAESGLKHQQNVMLLSHNSTDLIIACLGIIYAGGVCVPVDLQSSDDVLDHIIEDSESKWIFVDEKGLERLDQLRNKKMKVIRLDDKADPDHWRNLSSKHSHFDEIKADEHAVLFYTSGTTGMPKGVPLSHANIVFQLDAVLRARLVKENDRALLPLPLFHVYPFVIGLLVPLSLGISVILPKSITGPEIIRATKEGGATVLIAVPRLLRALYSAIEAKARANNIDSTAFDIAYAASTFVSTCFNINIGKLLFKKLHQRFPTLRLLASGGALLEPDLAKKLTALGWQIAIGYGLTETAPLLTVRMPNHHDLKSVGKAIPGVKIRIEKVKGSSDDGDEQPEIQVKGKNVFSGYRNLPEKTAESFTEDGWFKTGDTGYMLLKNLYITGRISTLLKSEGGKKIQPEEIEKAYEDDAAIREIGILQHKQKLVALVVPNITNIGHSDPHKKISQIIQKTSQSLPSYYRLTDFAVSKELLPRTNLGKIRRQELVKRYEEAKAAEKDGHAGAKEKERMSAQDKTLLSEPVAKEAWDWLNERFPEAEITLNKSPQLDLNVDSLEWLNLTLEIQERFGIELNEEAIARIDTVRDLIKEIADASHSGSRAESPFEKPESVLDDDLKKWLQPLGPFMLPIARTLYWANYWLMRACFRVSAVGLENVPKGQVIFTPNHESYLDAFALAAVLDLNRLQKTQWAGWAGIALANPINAFVYRLAQAIPIEAKRSLISSLALAAAVLKKKRSLIWFPEGERTLTGKLLPFKSGIGVLLQHIEVKVVPIRIIGTREALPPGAFSPRFEKITVVFGESVTPEELKQDGKGDSDAERIANGLHDKVKQLKVGH